MIALILTDLHANLDALNAVLSQNAGKYSEVWCMGDIVGYGPEPRKTLSRVRALNPVCVAGNHDRGATGRLNLADFSFGASDALRRHAPLLRPSEVAWLDALPLVRQTGKGRFTLCHGSLEDPIWDYILTARAAAATLELAETPVTLTGHTHVPAVWRRDRNGRIVLEAFEYGEPVSLRAGTSVVNPGSLGQPRDGNPAAHSALLDTDAMTVTLNRTAYSVERVMKKMLAAGYPPESVERYGEGR